MAVDDFKGTKIAILYHGSLRELNSRGQEQFSFTRDLDYAHTTKFYDHFDTNHALWRENVFRELQELGYDGLVNMRTIPRTILRSDANGLRSVLHAAIEGTPIIENRSSENEG
jgi:hypothetical protein